MKFGVYFFPTHYAIEITELAKELESRGYESLFVCEHTHIPASRNTEWPGGGPLPKEYYHTYDPFVALMAAASVTSTLQIGTGICLVPQHDVFNLAKCVSSVDRLSGGRLTFGIGGGWNVDEMENHGVRYNTRFKQLRETVLAMKAMWTEETAEFHGDFIDFDPVYSSPKPLQTPHPPIVMGGETDHTLRRVVEFCDGWLPRGGIDMVDGMARLGRIADEAGRPMSELSVTLFRPEPEADKLAGYAEAGVDRVLLEAPSDGRDACLRALDSYASLLS